MNKQTENTVGTSTPAKLAETCHRKPSNDRLEYLSILQQLQHSNKMSSLTICQAAVSWSNIACSAAHLSCYISLCPISVHKTALFLSSSLSMVKVASVRLLSSLWVENSTVLISTTFSAHIPQPTVTSGGPLHEMSHHHFDRPKDPVMTFFSPVVRVHEYWTTLRHRCAIIDLTKYATGRCDRWRNVMVTRDLLLATHRHLCALSLTKSGDIYDETSVHLDVKKFWDRKSNEGSEDGCDVDKRRSEKSAQHDSKHK